MRNNARIYAVAAALAMLPAAWAAESRHHHDGGTGHEHHDMSARESHAGKAGNPGSIDVTVNVTSLDAMRYEPATFTFKRGQTVKFVVTNKGQLAHEFGIGTLSEQEEHAQMMKSMPDMKHDDPNVITIEAGQTNSLVWQFTNAGSFVIGCHVPGHYQAGMKAIVTVRK